VAVGYQGPSTSRPPRAEAFSRPSVQPVTTVWACMFWYKVETYAYVWRAVVVQCLLVRRPHWPLVSPTHTGQSVSNPTNVGTSAVVKQNAATSTKLIDWGLTKLSAQISCLWKVCEINETMFQKVLFNLYSEFIQLARIHRVTRQCIYSSYNHHNWRYTKVYVVVT